MDYIKRIVGLPGDRLRFAGGRLLIDGRERGWPSVVPDERCTTGEVVVPEGAFYVLGDNLPVSSDSRDFGCVPAGSIRGRVMLRFWPPARIALVQ